MTTTARTPAQIGAIIQRERHASGLTQAQLGDRIGRRQATISKLEKGQPGTQLGVLFDVLAALNLDLTLVQRGKSRKTDIESIF